MAFSVDYQELAPSPNSRWRNGVFQATRMLQCAWTDRVTFLLELDTYPNNIYPHDEGPAPPYAALAQSVQIRGYDQVSSGGTSPVKIAYDTAVLTVEYDNRGPYIIGGQKVTERIRPSAYVKRLPAERLRWENNAGPGVDYGDAPSYPLFFATYEITFHELTSVPGNAYAYVNYVNSNPVTCYTIGHTFAAGTIVKRMPDVYQVTTMSGSPATNVKYMFEINPFGWNNHFRTPAALNGANPWQPMYVDAGGQLVLYPSVAFS